MGRRHAAGEADPGGRRPREPDRGGSLCGVSRVRAGSHASHAQSDQCPGSRGVEASRGLVLLNESTATPPMLELEIKDVQSAAIYRVGTQGAVLGREGAKADIVVRNPSV